MTKTTTKLPAVQKKNVSAKVVAKSLQKKAAPSVRKLKVFKIKSANDYSKAFELTKQLKDLGKEADDQLATVTDPLKVIKTNADLAIKNSKAIFQPFFDEIAKIDEAIKIQMLNWRSKASSKKNKLEQKFEAGKLSAGALMKKTGELDQTEGVAKVWTAVEINKNQTPDKYWIVDEDAVEADLKAGIKVKGWEWKQVETIRI